MKAFWVASAYQCFKSIDNPNEYDREALKDIIVKIKPYCQDAENGLFTVCKTLYNVGVTLIFQNHLTLTQIRGGKTAGKQKREFTFLTNSKGTVARVALKLNRE
jgi:HTH-type transcriptional regulator/antitoxin HigA